jgi:hypothetical protein
MTPPTTHRGLSRDVSQAVDEWDDPEKNLGS